jgi:hypothetical protein
VFELVALRFGFLDADNIRLPVCSQSKNPFFAAERMPLVLAVITRNISQALPYQSSITISVKHLQQLQARVFSPHKYFANKESIHAVAAHRFYIINFQDATFCDDDAVVRDNRQQFVSGAQCGVECVQVAVVNADQFVVQLQSQ